MREIDVKTVTENIKEMCIEANHFLSDDMKECLTNAVESEKSELGKKVLNSLERLLEAAKKDSEERQSVGDVENSDTADENKM